MASKDTGKRAKLVRDSFTIPKNEYASIEVLKIRAIAVGTSVKKSELLRAGLMVLQGLNDAAFKSALAAVPTLKTGRPSTEKAVQKSPKVVAKPKAVKPAAKTSPIKAAAPQPAAKSAAQAAPAQSARKPAAPTASRARAAGARPATKAGTSAPQTQAPAAPAAAKTAAAAR